MKASSSGRAASGTLFRGYVAALKKLALFDQVLRSVEPETARLMTDLPLPNASIDVRRHEDVMVGTLKAGVSRPFAS